MFIVEKISPLSDCYRIMFDQQGYDELIQWLRELSKKMLLVETSKVVRVSLWDPEMTKLYNTVFFNKYHEIDYFIMGLETLNLAWSLKQ